MSLSDAWYRPQVRWWLWLLLPLHALFVLVSRWRRRVALANPPKPLPVPVIVVGNISVGGTGKTPMTLALVKHLQAQGEHPAIVSRGYGGKGPFPLVVTATTSAQACGDEPLLLARRAQVPVVVAPNRMAAAEHVLAHAPTTTVIISDDGLQHYRLPRQFEIAVVDGERGLGNGWCLPIGPLRENAKRLASVDAVVVNGQLNARAAHQMPSAKRCFTMQLQSRGWRHVRDDSPCDELPVGRTVALAGIGHPQRFFATVKALEPREFDCKAYPDHYAFQRQDAEQLQSYDVILMTEKDAMKWRSLATENCYYLPVAAQLDEVFWQRLDTELKRFKHGS
ncbi:tetraacyldisaccharide 4'-kinase [Pseudidiomarina homiensis]|uniref:Tetraacyldisaccharide 4'-kinase n=1 Tax=Pseudidiomarina homiensis TaxID=364198 RepID=A0A432Y3B4_9GAMM|nr:tetraacyldisaccharide 4'-kinase [Pseudidiomarina homiensis]RUO55435.1 tetraacyldisaccharide 4'-kinase [Pseudidiomarina homiensis]